MVQKAAWDRGRPTGYAEPQAPPEQCWPRCEDMSVPRGQRHSFHGDLPALHSRPLHSSSLPGLSGLSFPNPRPLLLLQGMKRRCFPLPPWEMSVPHGPDSHPRHAGQTRQRRLGLLCKLWSCPSASLVSALTLLCSTKSPGLGLRVRVRVWGVR